MKKHREAAVRANQSTNGDTMRLIPPAPRTAPSLPGVHHAPPTSYAPSNQMVDHGYLDPRFVSKIYTGVCL